MSRDIYVQDIPASARSVDDIPDGWIPQPLTVTAEQVRTAVLTVLPAADFSDPGWGHATGDGFDIEVNIGEDELLHSFAFHVRASDEEAANRFVADVLARLGLRAFDPESESGIFQP